MVMVMLVWVNWASIKKTWWIGYGDSAWWAMLASLLLHCKVSSSMTWLSAVPWRKTEGGSADAQKTYCIRFRVVRFWEQMDLRVKLFSVRGWKAVQFLLGKVLHRGKQASNIRSVILVFVPFFLRTLMDTLTHWQPFHTHEQSKVCDILWPDLGMNRYCETVSNEFR